MASKFLKTRIGPIVFIFVWVAACSDAPESTKATDADSASNIKSTADTSSYPTGERINGPANVRSAPNGGLIFTLNDSVLVACTRAVNGWYEVGLHMDIQNEEYNIDTLRKGRDIIIDGKAVGKVMADIPVSTLSTGKKSWAELTGFTQADNIYRWSVIEEALTTFTNQQKDRSLHAFQRFITNFALEPDTMLNFIGFFNYENWIDDPSPLYRIKLLFQSGKLAGVVHSRPLTLAGTTDYPLEREFRVLFFNDVASDQRENFISHFNQMIRTVD